MKKKMGKKWCAFCRRLLPPPIFRFVLFCHKKWSVFTDLSSAAASNQFSISLFSR